MRKNKAVGFAIGLLLSACCITAYAGIVVTPERHIVELRPGESKTVVLNIANAGAEDIRMSVELKEWSKPKENKGIQIDSWLAIFEKEFDIKAGETKGLNIRVEAPKEAVGEMVAMIFLCYKEQEESPINVRYGNPLYLLIKGTERYDAKIEKINCKYDTVDDNDYLRVLVNLTNTGNAHIKPDITVDIFDKHNKQVHQIKLEDGDTLFPGKSNAYRAEWHNTELPEGIYSAKVICGYKNKFKLPMQETRFEVKNQKPE